jgi:prevent-host-death family protein
MKLSESVKSVSFLKNNTAEVLKNLGKSGNPMIITQNGEATAVLQDIKSYEKLMNSLTLLKLLALSQKDVEESRVKPVKKAFKDIRNQLKAGNE